MVEPAEVFTAYYIEYPDLGIATLIKCHKDGPEIITAHPASREAMLGYLHERAVEVFALTSSWEEMEGSEAGRKIRRWTPIELAAVIS